MVQLALVLAAALGIPGAAALAAPATVPVEAGPRSNACRQALATLQARESELAAATRPDTGLRVAADARWRALRAQAARACLGAEPEAPAPGPHSATAPIAVPSVVVPPIQLAPSAPRAPVTPAPPGVRQPPPVLTSCDPGGCWTSDGARVPRVGRSPPDPVGRCTLQGNLAVCL